MQELRFPLAAMSGTAITVMVFALLWHFVNVRFDFKVVKPVKIEFTVKRFDTPVEVKRPPKVTRPEPPRPHPQSVVTGRGQDAGPPTNWVEQSRPMQGLTRPRTAMEGLDRDPTPIVRIAADYPPAAQAQNIEGWVQVQFSIGATGAVEDAAVVAASPRGTFDAAALKAIARWRYSPKIENGVAVKRVGLQTVIRFVLQ
jgi:protein TonB